MKARIVFTALIFLALGSAAWAWEEVSDLNIEDRGDKPGLLLALERQAAYLAKRPDRTARVGGMRLSNRELLRGVNLLSDIARDTHGTEAFSRRVNEAFRIFRTSRPGRPGKAHFTAYYDPHLDARRGQTGAFRYPVYGRPPDLVERGGRAFRRVAGELRPYYTRREIEEGGVLSGRGLEIAWIADYVELHFLHIQGSGILRFPDGSRGTLHVAGTNGHPFKSPGRMLMSAGLSSGAYQDVKTYLRTHPAQARKFLTRNPRFIFFRMDDRLTSGSAGVPLTPGRTIATDKRIYAPGAIGFVSYKAPILDKSGRHAGYRLTSRIVTDADTGSAIVGPGRADLYVGSGPVAEILAGATNTYGEMYFLIPK